jgi:hypothetical protein
MHVYVRVRAGVHACVRVCVFSSDNKRDAIRLFVNENFGRMKQYEIKIRLG